MVETPEPAARLPPRAAALPTSVFHKYDLHRYFVLMNIPDGVGSANGDEILPLLNAPNEAADSSSQTRKPQKLPPIHRVVTRSLPYDDRYASGDHPNDAVITFLARGFTPNAIELTDKATRAGMEIPVRPADAGPDWALGLRPHPSVGDFTQMVGNIPLVEPNVRAGHEIEDISTVVNGSGAALSTNWIGACLCCLTGIGACWVLEKHLLIDRGYYGFSSNNGIPEVRFAGRHVLLSPFHEWISEPIGMNQDVVRAGSVVIVRVPLGNIGLALENGIVELLLPGLHVRNTGTFQFRRLASLDSYLISYCTIKMFIVPSGFVRICYDSGKVCVFSVGRYAVNSATFTVSSLISVRDQFLKVDEIEVLLDGGVSLLVSATMVYRVTDAKRLVTQLSSSAEDYSVEPAIHSQSLLDEYESDSDDGDSESELSSEYLFQRNTSIEIDAEAIVDDELDQSQDETLAAAILNTARAALARVFAGVHLEHVSAPATDRVLHRTRSLVTAAAGGHAADQKSAVLGGSLDVISSREGAVRQRLCDDARNEIATTAAAWGVEVPYFQVCTTRLADAKYARDYERASLQCGQAAAKLRAVELENQIVVSQASASASSVMVAAEGARLAARLEAEARGASVTLQAEAGVQVASAQAQTTAIRADAMSQVMEMDSKARQQAATLMTDPLSRTLALGDQRVQWAAVLNAQALTVLSK